MGVTLGINGDNTAAGWTTFTASVDTNTVYVSDSLGNDAWDGSSPTFVSGTTGPIKTIAHALAATTIGTLGVGMRQGFPDWLLFKSGDTWTDQYFDNLNLWGRSATEPMRIASYGSGARPIIQCVPPNQAIGMYNGTNTNSGWYLALTDLDFYCYKRDPADGSFLPDGTLGYALNAELPYGAAMHNYQPWGLIENCVFRFFCFNVWLGSDSVTPPFSNWIYRRNINHHAYSQIAQAAGLYCEYQSSSLQVWDNVFYSNGWYSGRAGGGGGSGLLGGPTGQFTGSISGTTLTVTAVVGGISFGGDNVYITDAGGGTSVAQSTKVLSQLTGAANGVGTYSVSVSQTVASMTLYCLPERATFSHGFYIQGFGAGGSAYPFGPTSMGNNVHLADASDSHFRSGGTVINSLSWGNISEAFNVGSPTTTPSLVSYCVVGGLVGNYPSGYSTLPTFIGDSYRNSLITFDQNLVTNNSGAPSPTSGGQAFVIESGMAVAITNNVTWFFGTGNANSISDYGTGSILSLSSLVGGTGYTPASGTATYSNVKLAGSGTPKNLTPESTPFEVAFADVTVTNGIVTSVTFPETFEAWGNGYAAGDVLSFVKDGGGNVLDRSGSTIAGLTAGSGFSIHVASVNTTTIAGNKYHQTNNPVDAPSYSFPDPTRTVERYDSEALGGAGTLVDFAAKALTQSKTSWTSAYTAPAVNSWLRIGFAMADPGSSSTPIMGQIVLTSPRRGRKH